MEKNKILYSLKLNKILFLHYYYSTTKYNSKQKQLKTCYLKYILIYVNVYRISFVYLGKVRDHLDKSNQNKYFGRSAIAVTVQSC